MNDKQTFSTITKFSTKKKSIIIVTYNNARTIKQAIDSVLKKYQGPFEIIVVDNNSSDDTLAVVENYGKKVHLLKQNANLGFSKANNIGIKKATGINFFT